MAVVNSIHGDEADNDKADDNKYEDDKADTDQADADKDEDDMADDGKDEDDDADKWKMIVRRTWNQIWEAALDKLRCTTPMKPPCDWPT